LFDWQNRSIRPPEEIEFVGGIFSDDRERRTVLGMPRENLGIDVAVEYGRLVEWKAAIAERERRQELMVGEGTFDGT